MVYHTEWCSDSQFGLALMGWVYMSLRSSPEKWPELNWVSLMLLLQLPPKKEPELNWALPMLSLRSSPKKEPELSWALSMLLLQLPPKKEAELNWALPMLSLRSYPKKEPDFNWVLPMLLLRSFPKRSPSWIMRRRCRRCKSPHQKWPELNKQHVDCRRISFLARHQAYCFHADGGKCTRQTNLIGHGIVTVRRATIVTTPGLHRK